MASPSPAIAFVALACALAAFAVDAGAREIRACASRDALSAGASSAREDGQRGRSGAACDATILSSVDAPPPLALEAGPRSAYVVIYRPRRLRQLITLGDSPARPLRFGVALVEAPASRLPVHGLARHGIFGARAALAMLGAHGRAPASRLASAAASDLRPPPSRRSRPTPDSDRSDGLSPRESRM